MTSLLSASHRRNHLLDQLPAADRALLDPHLKEIPLQPRELLHESQDQIEYAHFPHSGMISVLATTDDGEAIEIAAIGSKGAVGAMAGLGIRRAFGRAVVQIPGVAARIAASQLERAAQESRAIREMILRGNEALMTQAQQFAACGALHDVGARLARWLLQGQDQARSDTIELIQESLAQVLGVRRTTINLVMRSLQDAELIRCRRGQIEILDRQGLLKQSCSCYRVVRRQLDQILGP